MTLGSSAERNRAARSRGAAGGPACPQPNSSPPSRKAVLSASPQSPDMYEPVTAEKAVNDCCVHLLTTIGLEIMYPERAAQLRAAAGPGGVRAVPQAARQAILKVP